MLNNTLSAADVSQLRAQQTTNSSSLSSRAQSVHELLTTTKGTGFGKLSIGVPQEARMKARGASNENHSSTPAVADLEPRYEMLAQRAALIPATSASIAHTIHRKMLPKLIRQMRGAGLAELCVDNLLVIDVFERWYELLSANAVIAGFNVETGFEGDRQLQYSEAIFERFASMWDTTYAMEHDWVQNVRSVVTDRRVFVATGGGEYPEKLKALEVDLITKEIKMSAMDAAGVLLAWSMQVIHPDGLFFCAERHAGRWVAEIAGQQLRDSNHARIIGRKTLQKLIRLGIITVAKKGTARSTENRETEATTYRWIMGTDHLIASSKSSKPKAEPGARFPEHLDQESFRAVWAAFCERRQAARMTMSHATQERQLRTLASLDIEQASRIVTMAISEDWDGIPAGDELAAACRTIPQDL